MFIVLIGRTLLTDVISALTVPLPVQTEMLFGYPVTGNAVVTDTVYGYPAIGSVVQQPPVIAIAGNDTNFAFGEVLSPRGLLLF